MGSSNSSMSAGMLPWMHFGNADAVLFKAWMPSSDGAIAGTCIGLVVFAILERSLGAYRRVLEPHWRANRADPASGDTPSLDSGKIDGPVSVRTRRVPPIVLSKDIPRGVMQAVQSTFAYALMLVIMTYNGAYFISIVVGLGIGEFLFGRIGRHLDTPVEVCLLP